MRSQMVETCASCARPSGTILYPGAQIRHELLSRDLRRKLEVIWFSAFPEADNGDEAYQHEGKEIGIVLRGQAECRVGDAI